MKPLGVYLQQKSPVRATAVQLDDEFSSTDTSSFSDPTTVVRWATPPSRAQTPRSYLASVQPTSSTTEWTNDANRDAYESNIPFDTRLDKRVIKNNHTQAATSDKSLDMDSGPPTPDTDDTPYIRFAIDQLTRDEEVRKLQRRGTGSSADSYPVERIIPDLGLRYPAPTRQELEPVRQDQNTTESTNLFNFNATAPLSPPRSSNASAANQASNEDLRYKPNFIPVEPKFNTARYHDLTFIPTILRPLSMIMLTLMTLLMTAALMFCAIYSTHHNGLLACIFISLDSMRYVSDYEDYPLYDDGGNEIQRYFPDNISFELILAALAGTADSWIFCLFSVILVEGVWRWTAVQAVAWTLIAIYILIVIATVITGIVFFRCCTGLRWDPRSLADIMALLPRSNCLPSFHETDTIGRKVELKCRLGSRNDRLGYWHTSTGSQSVFYCIGEEYHSMHRHTGDGRKWQRSFQGAGIDRSSHSVNERDIYDSNIRFRYIPWYLQDSYVILWVVTGTVLLIALMVLSFLPSTAIRKGFPPKVDVAPNTAGFSSGNFLYSFIPSLLGQILFLAFQTVDNAIRKLQPWAELSKRDGCSADRSLLLDYHASFNFRCFLNAMRVGHYRVAALSLLSFLFILLPILAGGFLFPLTTPANTVRMIPNLPSFYILLSLLVLYLFGLLLLIPNRRQMYLPHGTDCLAEIISFMYGSKMLDDALFRSLKSRSDMVTRLLAAKPDGVVALTLDDAPSSETAKILDLLQQHGAKATFFVIGNQISAYPGILERILTEGHEIGNHDWADDPSFKLSLETLERQIKDVEALIPKVQGDRSSNSRKGDSEVSLKYFRPASGFFSMPMVKRLKNLGYMTVLGSIYSHDPQIHFPRLNARHILSMIRPGGIIIMHDRRSYSAEQLELVLTSLEAWEWRVLSVGGLLDTASKETGKRLGE
ncbi:hypothetical protein B7463_g8186, partial [Scytalidium lignicola]